MRGVCGVGCDASWRACDAWAWWLEYVALVGMYLKVLVMPGRLVENKPSAYFLRWRRRFFWRWLWDCARAGVRKSIKQSLSIITQECDKKCLFWDVLKVLVMRGRGGWNTWRCFHSPPT